MTVAAAYQANAAGDVHALVAEHQELVRRIAWHLSARLPDSVEIDDLVQAGQIGLIEAARQYRPDGGASFATFASSRIRGAMLDELRRGDWMPRSVHRNARTIAGAVRTVEARHGRAATEAEVAAELGMPLADYQAMAGDAARGPLLSLEGIAIDDEPPEIPDPDAIDAAEQVTGSAFRRALAGAIDHLPERERQVMGLYYDEALNLREIGAVLGVTESRVCQIHAQAVVRLRARLQAWL
ncbi:RNA polymerase sigma factor FliA [Algiphilus sp.]|uniref:RNA polymerase sigma factor FliA n=1 Tax=Algiphilus sp. TaxID=1872431 RepID=UPI0025C0D544|nr:RNA polymerase sigma factor FliA [Algiphilus sp.]MCK5771050.1 RNA polymerase sigma factor FliA [Algiphilus sp.]